MSKQMEKIVMMDSDEAAHIQTVTGWVDRHGRFWGNDEYQARWSGATHRKCKNKPDVHPVHSTRGYCEECHREARQAKFLAMERVVWSGEPLTIFDSDKYFFDAESLADYCVESSLLPSELQLVICEPNYPPEFDIEQHCEEIIPEGGDYFSLPQTVRDAADALNKAIKESEPVSWSGSDRSAIVSDDILTDGPWVEKHEDKDPRDLFEATFPMPAFVIRCGDGYACTEYSAWDANDFKNKWEGWKACHAAMLNSPSASKGE